MGLLIVDGSSIGSRAFHSAPISFFNMVETVRQETAAGYVIFCFDDNKPSFRQQLYAHYKGGRVRNKEREHFITSVAVALEKAGHLVMWGPEADDVIGGIVASVTALPIYIFTSDTDLWQLIEDGKVHCVWCGTHFKDRKLVYEADVMARYGVPPKMLPEYLGLAGENSDNIPGVAGIGDKGAQMLLRQWGTAEDIFEFAPQLEGRYAKAIQAPTARHDYELSKILATIKQNPVDIAWHKAAHKPFNKAVEIWVKNGD